MIRDFHWTDIPTACQIEAYSFPVDTWSPESFWGELARPREAGRYFAAVSGGELGGSGGGIDDTGGGEVGELGLGVDSDGELLGYAGVAFTGDDAHLQTIAVAAPARGRGVGRVLVAAVIEEAVAQGARRCLLEVSPDNAPALALYDALGFQEFGTRPGYYPGGGDALVLAKNLAASEPSGGSDGTG